MAAVFAVVLVLDQLTKQWAVNELTHREIPVFWTLVLHKVENKGAAFSMFGGGGMGPVIGIVAFVVVGVLVWQSRSVRSRWGAVALGLVAGGALGNLADRAFRGSSGLLSGGVVDWIDFQWWPVFNVADMGVVVGGILLGILYAFAPDAVGVSGSDPAEPAAVAAVAAEAAAGPAADPAVEPEVDGAER